MMMTCSAASRTVYMPVSMSSKSLGPDNLKSTCNELRSSDAKLENEPNRIAASLIWVGNRQSRLGSVGICALHPVIAMI